MVTFGARAKIATRLKISVNKGSTFVIVTLYPADTASSCLYCSQLLEVDIFPMQNCLNNKTSYATNTPPPPSSTPTLANFISLIRELAG